MLVPLLIQPFTAGFDIISHYIDTVKTAYRKERVFFIFKRTATVFRLYDRQLSCENFGKEIACSAGGFKKTAVDTLGFLFYKVAHCLYFTLGGENLAVFGNTLSGFYLLLHVIFAP